MSRLFYTFLLVFSFVQTNSSDSLCELFENSAAKSDISQACLKQMHTVCNTPELGWKLYDASSKFLTSGMSYSNVIDYGNFPECLSIDYEDRNGRILGKYCAYSTFIVNIFLTPETQRILTKFEINTNSTTPQLVSLETFSKINTQIRDVLASDIPHVISKHASCVPDACTPSEVGHFYWYAYILSDLMSLVSYSGIPCETVNSNTDYEAGDIAVIVFLVIIGLLMIASTIYDTLCHNLKKKPYHPLLLAFSVLFNGKKLLAISNNTTEQIQIFNGIRFISMMWVIAYHAVSIFTTGMLGLENFPEANDWNQNIWNRYIQSGLLAVDTFFFISGFLLAFSYIKTAEESPVAQLKKVPKMYLHRYLRLTPSVAVMYLVVITIYRFMGSGPTWTLVTMVMTNPCKQNWWQFFLYIQNYANPNQMCLNPTWYLSADMQMFILAPIVLIPIATFIKKSFKKVFCGLVCLTVLAVVIPIFTRYFYDQEAGNEYSTHDRFTDFLIGITFGVTMRMYKHKPYIFSPFWNLFLWVLVLVVSVAFNLFWFDVSYHYYLLKYTLFMAFYRPVWCLCLVFMVYSCYHNQGGVIQWFLSRPSFQILGRLSYSMYVLHAVVQIYAGSTLTTNSYFSNYFFFYNWCGHFIVTLILSVIWVLAFEFPMLTIDKYLLGSERKPTAKREN